MGRFMLGFFVAALVFNTSATIDFVGSMAEVAKLAFVKLEDTGSSVGEKLVEELDKRGVLEKSTPQ